MYAERHARTGIVTNQPEGYDRNRPHASVQVCDRDECQQKARFWVQGSTGEAAVYVPDAGRVVTGRASVPGGRLA